MTAIERHGVRAWAFYHATAFWLSMQLQPCFDCLCPIRNISVIKGRVFLGWTSTKLGLMFLLKDTTQWRRWGSNPRPLGLDSSTLPLSHCVPNYDHVIPILLSKSKSTYSNNISSYNNQIIVKVYVHISFSRPRFISNNLASLIFKTEFVPLRP